MTLDEFMPSVATGSYFEELDDLGMTPEACELRKARLASLTYIRTDAIWQWACREGGWVQDGVEANDAEVWPVLELLLRRYLLDLRTRLRPEALNRFWRWVIDATGSDPDLSNLWEGRADGLLATIQPGDVQSIAYQEVKFAAILADCAEQTRGRVGLRWANRTLLELAKARARPRRPLRAATVRIACVWESVIDPRHLLRPGLLLELTLRCPSKPQDPWLLDPEVFDSNFIAALEVARALHGPRHFYALSHNCKHMGQGFLTNGSGAMAVLAAQDLLCRRWPLPQKAIAPWAVISAAVDGSSGAARRAGWLAQKLDLLCEEGVRLILTAEAEGWEAEPLRPPGPTGPTEAVMRHYPAAPVRAAPAPAAPAAVLLSAAAVGRAHANGDAVQVDAVSGGVKRFVGRLKVRGALWPVVVPKLPMPRRWRYAALTLSAVLFLGVFVIGHHEWARTLTDLKAPPPNKALPAAALERRDTGKYVDWAKGIRSRVGSDARGFDKFFSVQTPDSLEKTQPDGYKILSDSRCFDLTYWEPVRDSAKLKSEPIEPCVFERDLWIVKTRLGAPVHLHLQMRTGGYQAWWKQERPGDVLRRCTRVGKLPAAKTDTYELDVDLTNEREDGKPFRVTAHAVIWNGFQDQQLSLDNPPTPDWAAVKTDGATDEASLLVILPPFKTCIVATAYKSAYGDKKGQKYRDNVSEADFMDPDRGMIYRCFKAPEPGWVHAAEWRWVGRPPAAAGAAGSPGPP